MVEFAFVGLLFVLLLTGLITFGLILSFKQNLTQAAAEGARAGAVATLNPESAARTAADAAVDAYDEECDQGALTCTITVADCDGAAGGPDCITVELAYDYAADPLIPRFPILSGMYPDTIRSASTAEVNP